MEDQIKERAKPYFYQGTGDSLAILFHGFTGSPDDLKELAKFLNEQGLSVSVPLLAGHGRHWLNLQSSSYYDWWKSADDELKKFQGQYKKIFLVGYSFGANLALDLAARYPAQVIGVISLGISVFLRNELLKKFLLPIVHLFLSKYHKRYVKRQHLNDYEDSGSYAYIPIKSLREFFYFIKNFTKRELAKVKMPVLIIHSKDDAITHPLSSQFVYERVGSGRKELMYLNDLNHNPLSSKRKNLIFGKIEEFIKTF
ncbi:MAG: alpha/beta fold hydrolase [Candidatus Komeilibacteria bacterium]|nr:alpha/beta fold hydrolase [Candidatus Komeilibacteria bacterium]